jgi:hypothetical protein
MAEVIVQHRTIRHRTVRHRTIETPPGRPWDPDPARERAPLWPILAGQGEIGRETETARHQGFGEPGGYDGLIGVLFAAMTAQGKTYRDVADVSRISFRTLEEWRTGHRCNPRLANFNRALAAVGLRLAIVPLARDG